MNVLTRVEVVERMTSEEFFRYAPEDQKAELIDGVMIMHRRSLALARRALYPRAPGPGSGQRDLGED
jgi:hypothetical protein